MSAIAGIGPRKSWRELDAARNKPRPSRRRARRFAIERHGRARVQAVSRRARRALRKGRSRQAGGEAGAGLAADSIRTISCAARIAATIAGKSGAGSTRVSDRRTTSAPPTSSASRARDDESAAGAAAVPPKEDGRAALRKKVIEALGRDEISRAIDRYVKAHGWPNDFEILEQALEHNKTDKQTEAMDRAREAARAREAEALAHARRQAALHRRDVRRRSARSGRAHPRQAVTG